MWIVVYMARNKETADKIEQALKNEGLAVKTRTIGMETENAEAFVEILVLENELNEAHSIIIDMGF